MEQTPKPTVTITPTGETATAIATGNAYECVGTVVDRLGPLDRWRFRNQVRGALLDAASAIAQKASAALVDDKGHEIALALQNSKRLREATFAHQGEELMVRSLQNRDRTARRLVEQEESAGELVEDDYATKLAKLDERLASGTISRDRYNDWRARLERNRDELLDDSNGARRLMSATLNSGYVGTNSAVKINPQ